MAGVGTRRIVERDGQPSLCVNCPRRTDETGQKRRYKMGYTHYFTQKRDLKVSEMERLVDAAEKIIAASGVPVLFEFDSNEPPELSPDCIRFNGKLDDGHETFMLPKTRPAKQKWEDAQDRGFQFCKTARKPYDVVVAAALCAVSQIVPSAFFIQTDGDVEDWEHGVALFNKACGASLKTDELPWFTSLIYKRYSEGKRS